MEKEDFWEDDFLRELIRTSPLESPSADFIEKVMAKVRVAPGVEAEPKTMYYYLKSALPYIGLAAMILLFIFSSDMPFGKFMPGNDYLSKYFLPYFSSLIGGFKSMFASRYVTFALGISLSAGFLVLVEHLFSRRRPIHHPMV